MTDVTDVSGAIRMLDLLPERRRSDLRAVDEGEVPDF